MIRADEIDPTLLSALNERLAKIFANNQQRDTVEARLKAARIKACCVAAPRQAGYLCGVAATFTLSITVPPAVFPKDADPMLLLFFAINGLTFGLGALAYRKIWAESMRYIGPDVMRAAPQLLPLSRAEQLYCEAVVGLMDTGDLLGEASQRETLAQLNELLASFRKLELTANHYRAAATRQPVPQIQHELEVLIQRRDALEDAAARETAEQSIRLCEQRLEQARRLEPLVERAQAQQDLVLQTLASLQASLARIKTTGMVRSDKEVVGLRETVGQITLQTRAVEDAVNEVMTLGT